MDLKNLQKNWDQFGRMDPMWAVLTADDKRGRRWGTDEFFASGEQEIEEVLNHIQGLGLPTPQNRALDFGCGVGRLTQALAGRFEVVCGVDIAPSMIEQAEKLNRFSDNCTYHLNQTTDLRLFEKDSFDFVYTNITLQHMRPKFIIKYLSEFLRILQPGGILAFQLPSERMRGASTVKRMARALVPEWLIDKAFHWKIRWKAYQAGQPVMEMYGIRREEVIKFLQTQCVAILDVERLPPEASVWQSYRYFVRKHIPTDPSK